MRTPPTGDATGIPVPDRPEQLAQLDYISGDYEQAILQFDELARCSALHPLRRARARRYLSLAYFQTNRFAEAASLPLRDPLTMMMRAFDGPPYRVIPGSFGETSLPFLQHEPWELPRVSIAVNGIRFLAKVDTGGDLFSLPWPEARRLGIEPAATASSWFAGGKRARTGFARLDDLELGGITVANVPVSLNNVDCPVIGTGLLRQFLPTIDYPDGRLTLRQKGTTDGGFPFWLISTHLLVAAGSLNGLPAWFLVDSGLEVDNGSCLAAPESTLTIAGIPIPDRKPVEGISGAGKSRLRLGEFPIAEIALGFTSREGELGVTGIFPRQLTRPLTLGMRLHGLISHNYLKHYRWTIDFDRMRMVLSLS
jgi:hypothetical protein